MNLHSDATLPGDIYRATHRASVVSILGDSSPSVRSYGSKFFNADRWTARCFSSEMCEWAKSNPRRAITPADIRHLVRLANRTECKDPQIVIAATPPWMGYRMAMALVGGAYHEAWHTRYTCRRYLTQEEVSEIVLPRWELLPDWSYLGDTLLEWSNLIEDIRIERLGNGEFCGAVNKMHDLQDFILDREESLRESHQWTPLSTLLALFRDAGLGYVTDKSLKAKRFYQEKHPEIYHLVENGPFRGLLEQAKSLSLTDDLGSLRLAMDALILVETLSHVSPLEGDRSESSSGSQCGQQESAVGSGNWTTPEVAQDLQALMQSGSSVYPHDFSSAMESRVDEMDAHEEKTLEPGERRWHPFAPYLDTVSVVEPSEHGRDHDRQAAQDLLNSVQDQTSFFQSRLRAILLSKMLPTRDHGYRKGSLLSSRNLATTYSTMQSGGYPQKAFTQVRMGLKLSCSAAIVVDESDSMANNLEWASQCLLSLAHPLDRLRCPTLVAGFQDGEYSADLPRGSFDSSRHHRVQGVNIRVFKQFEEPLWHALGRFNCVSAEGGTPMADGLQFGLHALSHRPEGVRILFLLTDGKPEPQHRGVIRWQKRLARDLGIHIVGVGIGSLANSVVDLFEDHVWVPRFEDLPRFLVAKLSSLIVPGERLWRTPLRLHAPGRP